MSLNPPENPIVEKLRRHILSEKPRITKFNIDWDNTVTNIPSYTNFMFNTVENVITREGFQTEFGKAATELNKDEQAKGSTTSESSTQDVKNLFESFNKVK